jgi:hypothetical protein
MSKINRKKMIMKDGTRTNTDLATARAEFSDAR